MSTYGQLLVRDLQTLLAQSDRLLEVSRIDYDPHKVERLQRETGVLIGVAAPDSVWSPLDEEGRRRQREALDQWGRWLERAKLMFLSDSEKAQKDLEKAAQKVTKWLDRSKNDFSIPPTLKEAPSVFRKHVQPLFDLLAPFQGDGPLVVVPDTNVILRNQDLPSWSTTLGTQAFTVLLVPGVLAEVDSHKINHRVPEVRDKARSFSSRIKGWRNQGSLSSGVRVQGEVYVRVAAREPNFDQTLSWLDSDIADDRIIASVLEWQRVHPMNAVRLLTSDSLMLAKADEAGIPTEDVPDPS